MERRHLPTGAYKRPLLLSEMARTARYEGELVALPARLTPKMRRDWWAADPTISEEGQDAVFAALKRSAVRQKGDGDGRT